MPNMPFAIRKHVKQTLNAPFTIRRRAAPIRRVSHPNPPRAQAAEVPYPRLPIPNAAPSVNALPLLIRAFRTNPPRAQAAEVPYPRLPIPNAAPSVNALPLLIRASHPNPPRTQATGVPYPHLPIPNAAPSVNALPLLLIRASHPNPPRAQAAVRSIPFRVSHCSEASFPIHQARSRTPASHLPPPPARSSFSKHLHHPAVDASLQLFSQLRRSSGSASAVCVTPPSVRVLSPSIPMRL